MSKRNKIFHKPGAKVPSAEDILNYLQEAQENTSPSASFKESSGSIPLPSKKKITRQEEIEEELPTRNASAPREEQIPSETHSKHIFEKQMLEDPFLDEAVEGFALLKDKTHTKNILQALNQDIQSKAQHRMSSSKLLRIAALLLLLFIGAGVTIHLYRQTAMVPEGLVLHQETTVEEQEVLSEEERSTAPVEKKSESVGASPLPKAPATASSSDSYAVGIQEQMMDAAPASEEIGEPFGSAAFVEDSLVAEKVPVGSDKLQAFSEQQRQKKETAKKEIAPVAKNPKGYLLKDGIERYNEGAYIEAKEIFEDVLLKQAANQEAIFYNAMTDYQLNNYADAQKAFLKVTSASRHFDEARWYRAQCLVKLGYEEEAMVLFKELAKPGNTYSERAMEELQRKR
jgi:hypothetical protein